MLDDGSIITFDRCFRHMSMMESRSGRREVMSMGRLARRLANVIEKCYNFRLLGVIRLTEIAVPPIALVCATI